jgi:FkbM family methyltransferase
MDKNSAAEIAPSSGDDESIIARNEFGVYAIPASSAYRPCAATTITGGVWERETVSFIRKHAGARDIIHAGAFFGDFLPPLSAALPPTARVWAFEPSPLSFRHAQQTIALNGIENVELRMAGLGETRAKRNLAFAGPEGSRFGGHSFFAADDEKSPRGETVEAEVVRIDDAVPADRDVGLVHLDLEGYELRALRGGLETIRRCRPIVIIEANKPTPRCVKLLAPLNYRIVGMVNGNLVLRPAEMTIALAEEQPETTTPAAAKASVADSLPVVVPAPRAGSRSPAAIEIEVASAVVRAGPGADMALLEQVVRMLKATTK